MSSTTLPRNEKRLDFYRTPAWVTEAIVPHVTKALKRRDRLNGKLPNPEGWTLVDAGAGDGAICNTLSRLMSPATVFGVEIDQERTHAASSTTIPRIVPGNWLHDDWRFSDDDIDAVVMNPPFSQAREFVARAIDIVRPRSGVVFALLRLGWMAGLSRADFHRAHPSDVYVLPRRPSFTGNGTDSSDYGWFAWRGPDSGGRWRVLDGVGEP